MFLIALALLTMQTFTTVDHGAASQIEEARRVVVRTAAEWSALWKAHGAEAEPPAIDFTNTMVLAVFAGTRPTAGHTITITKIDVSDDGVVVRYRETAPKPDEMVAQMLTAPFHIVRTDARRGKITFEREQ